MLENKLEEQSVIETFTPKIIHDGECDHEWEDLGFDPEGKGQVKCRKCPMGRYYDPNKEVFKDGKFQ